MTKAASVRAKNEIPAVSESDAVVTAVAAQDTEAGGDLAVSRARYFDLMNAPAAAPASRFSGPVSAVYQRKTHRKREVPYDREPLGEVDGIPLFSQWDSYVENYDNIAHDHMAHLVGSGQNPFMTSKLMEDLEESTASLIRKHTRRGDRILDVGVGLGRLLGPHTHLERYGVDISFDYLRTARDQGIEVAFSRIEDMPYRDDFFDAVVCTDVLEHVLDLNYCTAQILRVLRPGGVLILRVPLNDNLDVYADVPQPYEFIHLRKFDRASLKLHFEKIFDCMFIESLEACPYFKGQGSFRLRSFGLDSRIRTLVDAAPMEHPLAFLKPLLQISSEEMMNKVGALSSEDPAVYELLVEHLAEPLEINAVFIKRS